METKKLGIIENIENGKYTGDTKIGKRKISEKENKEETKYWEDEEDKENRKHIEDRWPKI